ncbi:DUF1839 family protein [Skermania piniformis]|uniref:DUF1839 family protein n=1 Tax=Skermania pinensis TaxID=39122 RepID=A0ABX8SGK5_9ACTN|nr:DUF1839 family protein [Skermania piniformis]
MTLAGSADTLSPAVDPVDYRPAAAHAEDRIWRETNCYLDLWIELLNVLGHDPAPACAAALSADHDGEQWTFLKPDPAELRDIYGLAVAEVTLWRPVCETLESGFRRGLLHTVEVDSWWLPDTEGTDYRAGHVKTTIVPLQLDRSATRMTYIHNAGVFELSGDDFAGVFGLSAEPAWVPAPYVEQIRRVRPDGPVDPAVVRAICRAQLDRRPAGNPMAAFADSVVDATTWLADAGIATFHLWAFATLRQAGSCAEVAADLAGYLWRTGVPAAAAAVDPFRAVAAGAKTVQFKMARAARGRAVDVTGPLAAMSTAWEQALDILDRALPPA